MNYQIDYYILEKKLLSAVENNNIYEINWIFDKLKKHNENFLSLNRLQNTKLKCISLITLLTRLLIKRNVSITKAFELSDSIIIEIDQAISIKSCLDLAKKAVLDYAFTIKEESISAKSKLIFDVIQYIETNIYQKLEIKQIAASFSITPNYLSKKFQKETNLQLHVYIIDEKIKKAENMLLYTDIPLIEISEKLNFSNQSHFSSTFKKKRGYKPSSLR